MANQAKLKSYNSTPRYKYGYEIPRNSDHAIMLDSKSKNTRWKDSVDLELSQINKYHTFFYKGHHSKCVAPTGYNKIGVHLVFDVKHDGKALSKTCFRWLPHCGSLDSIYSGVVRI
jgi:hypothetical protein